MPTRPRAIASTHLPGAGQRAFENALPKWAPYDQAAEAYMELGDTPQLRNHLLKPQLDFLEKFQSR